jgi:hypothetical protein
MRLAKFILTNLEPILAEWEAFAKSLPAGASMTPRSLCRTRLGPSEWLRVDSSYLP